MQGAKPQTRSNMLDDYQTVAERIDLFYDRYPDGRIITGIVEHDAERGFILIRAEVYRQLDDALPAATGHAFEMRSEGYVNKTSYIENCESSAVGRALAMLNFKTKRGIASREEMQKVERLQSAAPLISGNLIAEIKIECARRKVNLEDTLAKKGKTALEQLTREEGEAFLTWLQGKPL